MGLGAKNTARNQTLQNAQTGAANSKQQQGNSQTSYNQAQTNLAPYNAMGPADMTNAANAQLAADNANIQKTYNGLRQQAFQTLGQRGMGSAPSGFAQTANNALDVGQGGGEQKAFENAQINSQGQRNFATQTEAGLAGQQGGLAQGNLGTSTTAANDRVHQGSMIGDIAQGVGDVTGMVVPGINSVQAIGKAFGKLGSGASGVANYGGSGS